MLVIAALIPIPGLWRNSITPDPPSDPPVVLLGLDSLSLHDHLTPLREWASANSGIWYNKAVTPGLLTNSVWASILFTKPIKEHGIFHIWQDASNSSRQSLPNVANKRGYFTISSFSNQLTCWVGSSFPFDLNESGPVGWRQLASSVFENSSILLPLVKPVLPKIPFAASPPNHSGSFTYSINRQLLELFSKTSEEGKTPLIFAHLNYLHEQVYPKYTDLSWDECRKVLLSPAYSVKDRSFDWQDEDLPTDIFPLHTWKISHLQKSIFSAIEKTNFLNNKGKFILFSDHGNRTGLSSHNFNEGRFCNVLLVTFNFPARADAPISTIDIGSILGLTDLPQNNPVVEFVHIEPHEWAPLYGSAEFSWNGKIHLNETLFSEVFSRLQSDRPDDKHN